MAPNTSNDKIILYDFPGRNPGGAFSPSTWKARLALNMKGISYRTVWVDSPDIASHCISIGAEPTSYSINPVDGTKTPKYTFPVIHDPATGALVSDSFKIARYLDNTYPSHVSSLVAKSGFQLSRDLKFAPAGTAALQMVFEDIWMAKIVMNVFPMLVVDIANSSATARAREDFREKREARFGVKLEEMCPPEARPVMWKKALEGFTQVGVWLDENGGEGQFVMGDKLSWADIIIGSWLLMMRRMWGERSKEWQELMSFEGGRWKRFYEVIATWNYVDEDGEASLKEWLETE
ncbi:uncharacterized protein STEHIDRAFT_103989 [Stereum hirsutum FP-91666 SS1]|uniref:uncharacterized protein n=1 Tax=Stereum hirsutum (strain FP-91666) TaxID=721885 RepID=UPI0004449B0A|nr:uncharacterized protein STEHIDRAFT_103989 [Stereum hirsutum FP-91666 SS1]EIM81534.1 hypothetical protein STEHIDRAFT_103989 [Stereum hirsutum FP-91666 SS1]